MYQRHWHKPARMAYASNSSANVTNFNFVSLFNDSNGPYLLAVHDAFNIGDNASALQGFVVSNSKLGSSPVQGISLLTGEGAIPGQVLAGFVAALPTVGLFNWTAGINGWGHEWPFVVLRPGWSVTMYPQAVNTLTHTGFFWEYLTPDELEALYPPHQAMPQ